MNFCFHDARSLWRARHMVWRMTRRELSARYAGSTAGVFWAYIQPTLTVAAYFLVFDLVFGLRMGESSPTSRVGVYLVVGALPWLAFCESVSRGSSSLVEAGSMLQKNAIPPVLFVARSVLASWVVFVPLMLCMTVGYLALSGLGWSHLSIVALLVLQGLLALSLSYVLAILTAAFRDTLQVLTFGLSVGIYLSPVLFPLSLFPSAWQWVLFANPMTAFVLAYQSVLLQGQWPDVYLWAIMIAWLLLAAILLNVLIGRSRESLVDWT